MKRLLPLLVFAAFCLQPLRAQLPDGIVAPDFTATDINGNSWTLYELLDQGKSAVLFFGTTWSYNSWQYHEGHRLDQVWEQYGPDGTNEIIPFFIEVDDGTDAADLDGTGDATYGDWVTNTPYPIIDDANWIGELYALDDVPRVYTICPNRILYNAINYPTVEFLLVHDDCLVPGGVNNAGMLRFVDAPKEFCGQVDYTPNVRFQNLATTPMTSLSLQFFLNGNLTETRQWTGSAVQYQLAGVVFNPVTITQTTDMEVKITTVNGQSDDDPANNSITTTVTEGPAIASNFLKVELKTDYYPREIYWEIVDDQGTVFHTGGNPGIFTHEEWDGAYTEQEKVYEHEVTLPADGCYSFIIYDEYDDGICCGGGTGYYRLEDDNNLIYLQGGYFTKPENRPFSLEGASTIQDNAAIKGYFGPSGDICGEAAVAPVLAVQNLGSNPINSLKINVLKGTNVLKSYDWTGDIQPGLIDTFTLEPVTVSATGKLDFKIVQANGQPDTFTFQNVLPVIFTRRQTETTNLTLEFATDEWGYENYWQLTNSAGDLVASGSNQNIGPNGGGLQVATAADPGSYPPFSTITEQISLPDSVTDCYTFLFVDDWGDGINEPGYIKMTDGNGNLLFNFRPRYTGETYLIDAQFGPSATHDIQPSPDFQLSPNPTTDHLDLTFSGWKNSGEMRLELTDFTGKTLRSLALPAGIAQLGYSLDLAGFANGVYCLLLKAENGEQMTKRFVVAGR